MRGAALTLKSASAPSAPDAALIWEFSDAWPDLVPQLDAWIVATGTNLAEAILALSVFVKIETAILDGRLPAPISERICARVTATLAERNDAADRPTVLSGDVGGLAKAIGAASLPFHSRFMVEDVGLATG